MDYSRTALIIIDMINNFKFKHGPELAGQTKKIAHNISYLKKEAMNTGIPIIYVNDHYNLWKSDIDKLINHCNNKLSKEIIDLVYPKENDFFLIKPKHSCFYETSLHTLLEQKGIKTLILTGIAGNICVLFTANDAYMREYNLIVPSDCIASNDEQDNQYALTMMRNVLNANTSSSRLIF